MLDEIILKFGESTDSKLSFRPQEINVIVGPNNSGKSLLLREILQYVSTQQPQNEYHLIDKIKLIHKSTIEIEEILDKRIRNKNHTEHVNIIDSNGHITETIDENIFKQSYFQSELIDPYIEGFLIRFLVGQSTLLLNGQTRLDSLKWKDFTTIGETNFNYNNVVNKIINDDSIYNKLQEYVYDAFKLYPEIKINGSMAQIVLSNSKIPEDFRLSIKPEANEFLKNAQNNENTSDGRKAYIGIISEIISGKPNTILLDEPEAFLHPPLARKLGNVISKLGNAENKKIFISSHSSNFIMGCIEARVPINIIRLTYEGEKATAKLLDNESLSNMMKNPLLRSTNVLDGIFFKNVIVTESDSDRVFYQEINQRLKDFKPEWHIDECLFLNAQNKQTVGWITKELRKIGIPTVSIIDLDLIKDGGGVFTDYLKSVNIPVSQHPGICTNKESIKNLFPNITQKNSPLKTHGIKYLSKDDKPLLESFLSTLNTYGLFPVPIGELEAWLSEIPLEGHGNTWITNKFELMGDNPDHENYIKPKDDDVWLFIKQIKDWFDNSERRGM
ncbi:AAA family ATPase [Lysinibacillus parviboronicapiens]|uniref:AAA family ATPase n=1 Tax=Lysinibacillus parviboronicapiens TaxID=436516 RepID=UPI000D38259C|nr:AAA family ATPase [Lysinibacillus parviboronicapiens]